MRPSAILSHWIKDLYHVKYKFYLSHTPYIEHVVKCLCPNCRHNCGIAGLWPTLTGYQVGIKLPTPAPKVCSPTIQLQDRPSLGGTEPPTCRLTAEHANWLCHRDHHIWRDGAFQRSFKELSEIWCHLLSGRGHPVSLCFSFSEWNSNPSLNLCVAVVHFIDVAC